MVVLQDLYCVVIFFFSHCKPSGTFAQLDTVKKESASPGSHLTGLLEGSGLELCSTNMAQWMA